MASEHLREGIRAFLSRHKPQLNVSKWEKLAGLGEGTLRKFLDPDPKKQSRTIEEETVVKLLRGASEALNRPVFRSEFDSAYLALPAPNEGAVSPLAERRVQNTSPNTSRLLWFRLAHGVSGERGAFVLIAGETESEFPRSDGQSKSAFVCSLLDNANGPGYAAGHVVVVDPEEGAQIGDFCIFTSDPAAPGGAPSKAGILRDFSATHWLVTQNASSAPLELPRAEYPNAWPVVAHYPRARPR